MGMVTLLCEPCASVFKRRRFNGRCHTLVTSPSFCGACFSFLCLSSFLLDVFVSSFSVVVRPRQIRHAHPAHERIAGWTTRITSNGRADTEHVATIRACVFLSFRRSRGNVHGNSIGVPLLGRSASPYSRLGCQSSLPKPLSVRAAMLHCRAQLQTRGSESCTRIACF